MECIECECHIGPPDGKFFGTIGEKGVRCEKCAVAKYKRENPLTWQGVIDNGHPGRVIIPDA